MAAFQAWGCDMGGDLGLCSRTRSSPGYNIAALRIFGEKNVHDTNIDTLPTDVKFRALGRKTVYERES